MAEPAIRDLPRLPRIDPAWRLPTEAELPYEDDEPLAASDYQLEPLGYAFYGLRGHYRYEPIAPMPGSGIVYASGVLGLELRLADGAFRIRDPVTGEDLRGPIELAEALEAETTARGREEVLRRDIEEAYRREKAAQNEGDLARRLAEAKQLEAEAALLRSETALRQAESARGEAEVGRLEAEAGRRDAEAAAQQAAERIAELEARLQRRNR